MQLWLCKRTYNERNNNSSKMRIGRIVDVEVVWCVPYCKEVEKVKSTEPCKNMLTTIPCADVNY